MPDTSHLIVTVHGIRTYGNWQGELEDLLEAAEPGVAVLRYQYGFFSSLAFLIPPLRWLVARRFRNFLVEAIRSVPEGARIDLVAHSFGTYLAAAALPHLPAGRKIHTVIFAGSVLRPSFPWYKYLQARAVGRLVNECGWDDSVLVLCQCTALLMGMAGRIGFHGMISNQFINRYYRFGHGGYFDPHRQLMREQWVPLLTTNTPVSPHDERPPLTALGGIRLFLLNNMQFIKVVGACMVLMTAVLIPLDWYRKVEYQKNAERLNHIALLTNAQEIPGRDPAHVRDLLKIDAKASGNERAIDHLIGTQNHESVLDNQAGDEDDEPRWWERLLGMSDHSREAYRARRFHAMANQQLVVGKDEDGGKAKAQALYEEALKNYRQVDDYDPAHGSYALCLIDYGTLLDARGEHEKAIQQYQRVREEIFPPDNKGKRPSRPPSLAVDSLIFENQSLQSLKRWAEASDRLEEAVRIAKEERDDDLLSKDLLSNACTYSGWLHMERLEVDEAIANFKAAEAACKELVIKGRFEFTIRLSWIRHGLALAERLKGSTREAYYRYEELISRLRRQDHDLKFTPKQRFDLRVRLINSLERRADVRFFASQQPAPPVADEPPTESASRFVSHPNPSGAPPLKVVSDFQEAIEAVGNDDLSTKTRLLYKKVIARFMAELELKPPPPIREPGARDDDPSPIDLEFAEANRTLVTLPVKLRAELIIYREIAGACMALRETAAGRGRPDDADSRISEIGFSPQAVEKLRAITVDHANGCENLKREYVEMLLLAFEILLKPGVEPDPGSHAAADATRMLAVLGETTKVASHPELSKYFERFQKIASVSGAPSGNSLAVARRTGATEYVPATFQVLAEPETLLFFLRLSPRVSLRLTAERAGGRAPTEPRLIDNPAHTSPPALMTGEGTRRLKTE